MKLYHWDQSKFLKNYGHGDIIVMAKSIEEARTKAHNFLKIALYKKYSYGFPISIDELLVDECYAENVAEDIENFGNDIEIMPTIVESGVIFIEGGE